MYAAAVHLAPVALVRWWPDRSRRMAWLLVAIAGLSVVDLVATLLFMCTIGMFESNPIVVHLARVTGSAEAIAIFKVTTTSTGIAILYRVRDRVQAEVASWSLAIVLLIVFARWVAYSVHAIEVAGHATLGTGDSGWVMLP